MGFRYRKSLKIAPGLKVNIGKNGFTSVSIGKKGASVNINKKGTRSTIGIPGSGLSYSSYSAHSHSSTDDSTPKKKGFFRKIFSVIFWVVMAYISYNVFYPKDSPVQTHNPPKETKDEDTQITNNESHPTNKSIADSQDKNDTLSVKTSIRENGS